jgi:hypothetical protein
MARLILVRDFPLTLSRHVSSLLCSPVMYAFASAIFVSAFLLFMVQPLMGRFILPWFGGVPAAWTVTLMFFQTALLVGYGYAHFLTKLKNRKAQVTIHSVLLLSAAAFMLPIIPSETLKPAADANPAFSILLLLALTVGLPFIALSATGPLMQAWLAKVRPGKPPWIMYALSNVGSLGALLAYPFLLEPFLGRTTLAGAWSVGFVVFVGLTAWCIYVLLRKTSPEASATNEPEDPKPVVGPAPQPATLARRVVWIALAACGVWMLMGATNKMTLDLAPVPFLWVLPLSLYLLSFVVTFAGPNFYQRNIGMGILPIAFAGFLLAPTMADAAIMTRVAVLALSLFGLCWVLHGELYRLRPTVDGLTGFYFSLSAGGALGGIFVGIVAPLILPMFWEYQVGMILSTLAFLAALAADKHSKLRGFKPAWAWIVLGVLALVWSQALFSNMRLQLTGTLDHSRSFFGVLRVYESPEREVRRLQHGNITHGTQYIDERRRTRPISYYSPNSGIGRVMLETAGSERRIGMIGLGIGSLAAYGHQSDVIRFYEIDPEVEVLARRHFWYLEDCRAEVEIVIGDGRLSLEREEPQQYDILAVDAFSSDAIPVHLITLEAFEEYLRHLKDDGILAMHITNNYLNLLPVCAAAADKLGLYWTYIEDFGTTDPEYALTDWVLMGRDPERIRDYGGEYMFEVTPLLWTDDYSNIFRILR